MKMLHTIHDQSRKLMRQDRNRLLDQIRIVVAYQTQPSRSSTQPPPFLLPGPRICIFVISTEATAFATAEQEPTVQHPAQTRRLRHRK